MEEKIKQKPKVVEFKRTKFTLALENTIFLIFFIIFVLSFFISFPVILQLSTKNTYYFYLRPLEKVSLILLIPSLITLVINYLFFKVFYQSNFHSKIASYRYIFHFLNFKVLTILTFIVTYLHFYLKDYFTFLNNIYKSTEIYLILLSGATLIITSFSKIFTFNKNMYYLVETSSDDLEHKIQEEIKLDEQSILIKEPYTTFGEKEYFAYSNEINYLLYLDSIEENINNRIQMIKNKNKYILPSELNKFAPFALKKKIESRAILFNSQLCGQITEFEITEKEGKVKLNNIEINKTRYFDTIMSNALVYKNIVDLKQVESKFSGEKLLLTKDSELITYNNSYLANHIGVNTLAITNDNYLIVNVQGSASDISPNKLINSGSGSLTFRDFKKMKKGSLKDVLIYGAERELIEECGLKNNTPIKSNLIGFMKILKFGGKPDYFAASKIDLNHFEVEERIFNHSKEIKNDLMQLPLIIKLEYPLEESIINIINDLQSDNSKLNIEKRKVAVQLNASKIMIEYLLSKDIRVYTNLN